MAESWFSLSQDDQVEALEFGARATGEPHHVRPVACVEKDAAGARIDYFAAISGQLQLIPAGASLAALEKDYAAMLEDGLLALNQPSFADIIEQCRIIQDKANR